jgi:hypothetical protein
MQRGDLTPLYMTQREDFCKNYWHDSLLHHAEERFYSPLQNAVVRFDSPLHDAAGRFLQKLLTWLAAASCSGEILLPAAKCSGEIWLPAASCSGDSNFNSDNSMNFKPNLKKTLGYESGSKVGTFYAKKQSWKSRATVPLN